MIGRARLGDVEFDALIECTTSYEAEVPQYPTEKGFSVSESVLLKPLMINAVLDMYDGVQVTHGSAVGTVSDRLDALDMLMRSKKPTTFKCRTGVYKNMCIESYNYTHDTEHGLLGVEVELVLTQVRITEASTRAYTPTTAGYATTTNGLSLEIRLGRDIISTDASRVLTDKGLEVAANVMRSVDEMQKELGIDTTQIKTEGEKVTWGVPYSTPTSTLTARLDKMLLK